MAIGRGLPVALTEGRGLAVDLDPGPPGLKYEGRHDQGRAQHDGDEDTPKRHGRHLESSARGGISDLEPDPQRCLAHLDPTQPGSRPYQSGSRIFRQERARRESCSPRLSNCVSMAPVLKDPERRSKSREPAFPASLPAKRAGTHLGPLQRSLRERRRARGVVTPSRNRLPPGPHRPRTRCVFSWDCAGGLNYEKIASFFGTSK